MTVKRALVITVAVVIDHRLSATVHREYARTALLRVQMPTSRVECRFVTPTGNQPLNRKCVRCSTGVAKPIGQRLAGRTQGGKVIDINGTISPVGRAEDMGNVHIHSGRGRRIEHNTIQRGARSAIHVERMCVDVRRGDTATGLVGPGPIPHPTVGRHSHLLHPNIVQQQTGVVRTIVHVGNG